MQNDVYLENSMLLLQRERWVKWKHAMHLIRRSMGAYSLFLPFRRRIKKVKKIKSIVSRIYIMSRQPTLPVEWPPNEKVAPPPLFWGQKIVGVWHPSFSLSCSPAHSRINSPSPKIQSVVTVAVLQCRDRRWTHYLTRILLPLPRCGPCVLSL